MKRYLIVESEGEQLFMIKNLFSLRKTNGKILFSDKNVTNLEVMLSYVWTTDRALTFIDATNNHIDILRRSMFKHFSYHNYRIHYKCFDDLKEWLKEKQETNLIL